MRKITIKIIPVNFYKYNLKFRVVNSSDSDLFYCHFINSEYHDFVNSYQTDFFIVNKKEMKFYKYGKLEEHELRSLWNQIDDIFPQIQGHEFLID